MYIPHMGLSLYISVCLCTWEASGAHVHRPDVLTFSPFPQPLSHLATLLLWRSPGSHPPLASLPLPTGTSAPWRHAPPCTLFCSLWVILSHSHRASGNLDMLRLPVHFLFCTPQHPKRQVLRSQVSEEKAEAQKEEVTGSM